MEGEVSNWIIYGMLAAWFVLIGIPCMQILHRTGFTRAWILLVVVPPLAIIFLWVYAFIRWPVEGEEEGKAK